MKLLVIGGSYFFGRWFLQFAHKDNDITVINRGNVPINLPNVKELKADRHDIEVLKSFNLSGFDCIIDFCAYNPGDIKIIANLFGKPGCRYLYISTVDVYKKNQGNILSEDAPLCTEILQGEVGAYINGKVALEQELIEVCENNSMYYSSIRPAILYGPANYAPREGLYFSWIEQAGQIIVPLDSDGVFQLIYVADAAIALLKLCSVPNAKLKKAYNFCNSKIESYQSFHEVLRKVVKKDFEEIPLSLTDIVLQGVPLPFPLTKSESEIYDSSLFYQLIDKVTPLEDGMRMTCTI